MDSNSYLSLEPQLECARSGGRRIWDSVGVQDCFDAGKSRLDLASYPSPGYRLRSVSESLIVNLDSAGWHIRISLLHQGTDKVSNILLFG